MRGPRSSRFRALPLGLLLTQAPASSSRKTSGPSIRNRASSLSPTALCHGIWGHKICLGISPYIPAEFVSGDSEGQGTMTQQASA